MGDLRSELLAIYQTRKALTPQLVVDEARPLNAPLHGRFEWNDTVAGEAYRRHQASELIRSVKIEYSPVDAPERKFVRGFVSAQEGYRPTEEVVQDEFATKLLLQECERDIADLTRKYSHLVEFADLMRAAVA